MGARITDKLMEEYSVDSAGEFSIEYISLYKNRYSVYKNNIFIMQCI